METFIAFCNYLLLYKTIIDIFNTEFKSEISKILIY